MTSERGSGSNPADQSLWVRWTRETGSFYRSCAVWPIDHLTDRQLANDDNIEKPELEFCSGNVRIALRNAPVLILLLGAISFTAEQLNDWYSPIGTYLPIDTALSSLDPALIFLVPILIFWIALITRLFSQSVGQHRLNLHRDILFYGTTGLLLAGVVFSIYLVATGRLTDPRQHLTFRSGYFLFVLLEAHLVYDGLVLRGENLFSNFGGREIVDSEEYDDFLQRLTTGLSEPVAIGPITVPRATVFALVVLAPIAPLPVIGYGGGIGFQNVYGAVSYTIMTILQFVLVAVLFQFGVLLWYFNELLSGDYLTYKPFHPDEHGGYRDLGRFATRINVVFVIAGAYVVFRFFTGGLQQLNLTSPDSIISVVAWVVSYIGPIVVYGIFVLMWLYFSFYRMHRQMREGRQRKINELQTSAWSESDTDQDADETRRLEDPEIDGVVWESLQNAPVWPISQQRLAGIIVLDALPVVISFVT